MSNKNTLVAGRGYEGKKFILVNAQDHTAILHGQKLPFEVNGRMSQVTVEGGAPPHKSNSSGRIYIKPKGGDLLQYFPSVLQTKWLEVRA